MTMGTRLVVLASAILALTIAVRAQVQPPAPAPVVARDAAATAPDSTRSDYLGSDACARCHEREQKQWTGSLHVQMTKPVDSALIVGDFAPGTRFSDHGRSYAFGRRDGKPFVRVSLGGRPEETFQVDYTLGAKRYQGYLSTLSDGRILVLPVFWHLESRRWLDWKETTPIPDGAHDVRQIWNVNCFNCHGTNIVQGFDPKTRRYNSTWTEMGIGCEACHGPGREHVALMDRWEKDPTAKPAYDDASENAQLSDILKTLSTRSASPRRVFDACAYCHGNKTSLFVGFRAGDRYEDFALPFKVSDALPATDLQGEFWPDGRPNRFNRPQALMLSGCFKAGAITCTNCHVAHGSGYEHSLKVNIYQGRYGDVLCTQCHSGPKRAAPGQAREARDDPNAQPAGPAFTGSGLSAHTFHAPESAGSRCINCHMSDVNWRLLVRRRDHTFAAPVPETTARFGVPNACTTCHDDKTPEWAAKQMDQWWGDGPRRAASVKIADAMYRAGSGDATVVPELARIAVDRGQGAPMQASAVDYLGQFARGRAGSHVQPSPMSQTSYDIRGERAATPSRPAAPAAVALPPAIVNALIGAAADPEAMVRAAAVSALAAAGPLDRVVLPLAARVTDPARVVRVRAAETLLSHGIVTLPGPAGRAIEKAQDEWADSTRAFPDAPSGHAARGWLESERGRVAEAQRALDEAIALAPTFARPWVLKGVIAARENRFADAIQMWKKAKALDPSTPNIDAMIEEAEKRRR